MHSWWEAPYDLCNLRIIGSELLLSLLSKFSAQSESNFIQCNNFNARLIITISIGVIKLKNHSCLKYCQPKCIVFHTKDMFSSLRNPSLQIMFHNLWHLSAFYIDLIQLNKITYMYSVLFNRWCCMNHLRTYNYLIKKNIIDVKYHSLVSKQ